MKKYLLPCAIILSFLSGCKNSNVNTQTQYINTFSSEGSQEASARSEWERKRLCDPVTGKIPPAMRVRELAFAATLPNDAQSSIANRQSSILSWDFRGPNNVGGRTRAFAIDVTNESILFAGGVSSGLWRSIDGGATWTRVSSVNVHPGVNAIAQDKRAGHTNTWYYLSGEAYGTSASGGAAFYLGNGMYKSTDGGLTWVSLPSTVSGTPQTFENVWDVTWNVVTDAHDTVNDRLYACMYSTLYRSINGGTSWTLLKGGPSSMPYSYFTDVAVTSTGVVYSMFSSEGVNKGVWRSPDGSSGASFTNIIPLNFPVNYDRLKIEIDPNNENIIYFFGPTPNYGKSSVNFLGDVEWNSLWKYEYLSGNGSGSGGVWTDLSANLPGYISQFGNLNTQGGYDLILRVKPGSQNILFVGGTNIFRSTTAFGDSLNTTQVGGYAFGASLPFVEEYPGHHPDQHDLVFLPSNPDMMYAACDGGVSKTLDNTATPVVWNEMNIGYITSQFYTIAIDHASNNDIIIGGLQDNGTYFTNNTNSSSPWYHSIDGDGSYCQITDGGGNYYFSKQLGKMVKSTVDQATGIITAYCRIDPIGGTGYQFINPYMLDPNNNNMMYLAAGRCIWRNDDLSAIALNNQYDTISTNWVQFNDSLTAVNEEITAVAISKLPANRLYFGTSLKNIYRIDNAHTGNPTKTLINSTLFPATAYASCIAVDPTDADKVLLVYSNYNLYSLFYTTDGGTTWQKVAGNLEQFASGTGNGPSCRWASILPVSDGTVYLVATSTGLFATDTMINNATVWVQQGYNNIGSAVVDMIDSRTGDGLVATATHGSGIFSTHITSISDITTVEELNASLTSQINLFPNPATNVLNIELKNFKEIKHLKFTITNEVGMLVKQIENTNNQIPVFNLNIQNLPSGIYYLNIDDTNNKMAKGFVKM